MVPPVDALYQSTVVPDAVAFITVPVPPQIADGVVTVGTAGSGFTVTVIGVLVAETQPVVVFLV